MSESDAAPRRAATDDVVATAETLPAPVQPERAVSPVDAIDEVGEEDTSEPTHVAPAVVKPSRPAPDAADVVASTRGLLKVYGKGDNQVVACNRIDVSFLRGSFTAIMGPSGSGKSTLMHCLAGLDRATEGTIMLAGTDITRLNDRQLTKVRRDQVGFIFQAFNLLPTLTAKQNILLPLELAGRKVDQAHLDNLVDSLGLADRLHHRPSELSGGQQQRVAIARALVAKPDVVFADEPTGALDSKNGHALLAYLKRASQVDGQTIVMVTHDPLAASYADRVLMLSDGRIVRDLDDPSQDEIMAQMKALTEAAA